MGASLASSRGHYWPGGTRRLAALILSITLGALLALSIGSAQTIKATGERKVISRVAVPRYPNGGGRDQEINSYALPQLVDETVTAQSAQIDMVSGATYTSQGYLASLQSAIDKARA